MIYASSRAAFAPLMVRLVCIRHFRTDESLLLLIEEVDWLINGSTLSWRLFSAIVLCKANPLFMRWLWLMSVMTLDFKAISTSLIKAIQLWVESRIVNPESLFRSRFCGRLLVKALMRSNLANIVNYDTWWLTINGFLLICCVEVDWCDAFILCCIFIEDSISSHSSSWKFIQGYLSLSYQIIVLQGHSTCCQSRVVQWVYATPSSHYAGSIFIWWSYYTLALLLSH